jgi:hypothetical protein
MPGLENVPGNYQELPGIRELVERNAFLESFTDQRIGGVEKAGLKEAKRVIRSGENGG